MSITIQVVTGTAIAPYVNDLATLRMQVFRDFPYLYDGTHEYEQHYMDKGRVGDLCGFVTTAHHPILDETPRLKPLVRFSRAGTAAGDAGLVGQHTARVLADYGYSEADIARLAAGGVIGLG